MCDLECIVLGDIEPVVMPQRSVLYRLQPIAKGTSQRESLSSYLCRLADAHCLTPNQLAEALVLPRLGRDFANAKSKSNDYWQKPFFNGIGEVPRLWVEVLQDLTSVSDLHALTLLPLKGGISNTGLTAKDKRWCPVCFLEAKESRNPLYGKLIWEIEAVTACPEHGVKLASRCGCTPPQGQFRPKLLPHICRFCGGGLDRNTNMVELANEREVFLARLIERFLGSRAYYVGTNPNSIRKFLSESVTRCANGKASWLANILGVGKSLLHGWMHGDHAPSFTNLVLVAEKLGCDISDILEGNPSELGPLPIPQASPTKNVLKRKLDIAELGKKLAVFLNQDDAISVVEAAKRIGVPKRTLYKHQEVLTKQLSARRKEFLSHEVICRRQLREERLRAEMHQLILEGKRPTRQNLIERLGYKGGMLLREDRLIYYRVVNEEKQNALTLGEQIAF